MRPLWKDILAALWMGMILPGIVLNIFVLKERYREEEPMPTQQALTAQEPEISILVGDADGVCRYMDLDAYLTGVLLAEIPADFHEEALKAQSVAARTYTWKAHTTGGKHGDGSVCTDPACCQAYITQGSYLSRGGSHEDLEKVQKAVEATSDMVLAYDGELIEATYFSSSGGRTEAAVAVWGTDYPYLQAVSSPEEANPETVIFTREEFQQALGLPLSGDAAQWLGPVTYTEGGGVASMEIGGETFTGVQLRSLLALRSTAFQMQPAGDEIQITTKGYGHRVGMSQYGANAMAEQGSTWQQILQHYYPGTTLFPINQNES